MFCADPCVAVIPILIAAAPPGWTGVLTVIVAYEIATIATMILLVLPARAGVALIRARWLESYEHAIAGPFFAAVGLLVGILGI